MITPEDHDRRDEISRDLRHAVGGLLILLVLIAPGVLFGKSDASRRNRDRGEDHTSRVDRERETERDDNRDDRRASGADRAAPTAVESRSDRATEVLDALQSGQSPSRATTTPTPEPTAPAPTITSVTTTDTTQTTTTTTPTTTTAPVATTTASPIPAAVELSADELVQLASLGYLTVPSGELTSAATRATIVPALTTSLTLPSGTAQVSMPAGTTIVPTTGAMDLARLRARDGTSEVTNATGSMLRAIEYGVPGTSLTFDRAVTITIPVGRQYERQVLEIYRSPTANLHGVTAPMATCVVTNGACAFLTNGASYFVVIASGSNASGSDFTPPAPPSAITVTMTSGAVTLVWRDPPDRDLARVAVLRNTPPSTAVSGSPLTWVPRGIERYVDRSVVPGQAYLYILRAEDGSGNARNSEAVIMATPVEDLSLAPNSAGHPTVGSALVRTEAIADTTTEEIDASRWIPPTPFFRAVYGDRWEQEIEGILQVIRSVGALSIGGGR